MDLLCSRFCPIIWMNLSLLGHQTYASQTACKLMNYTSVGMLNVVGFLLVCLVMYAWTGSRNGNKFDQLDTRLRRHAGWLVLFLFALEGAAGIAPAIYSDVGSEGSGQCMSTPTISLTLDEYLTFHTLTTLVFPYLVPFIVMIYPLVAIQRSLPHIDDQVHRSAAKTIFIVGLSFILTYAPLTFISLVFYPLMAL